MPLTSSTRLGGTPPASHRMNVVLSTENIAPAFSRVRPRSWRYADRDAGTLMSRQLHKVLLPVNHPVAHTANDRANPAAVALHMTRRAKSWEPPAIRLHRINEWAASRNMGQSDIIRETGIDKSTVSRWFRGAIPREDHLKLLCDLFHVSDPSDLFMHPNNDWMARLLRERSDEEVDRIKVMLEAAFPKKVA